MAQQKEKLKEIFVPHRFIQLNIIYHVIYHQCKKGKGAEPISFNSVAMLKLLNCYHMWNIKLKFLFNFKPALIYLQRIGVPYICKKPCVMTLFAEYFPSSKPAAWKSFNHRKCIDFIFYSEIIKASNVLFIHELHSAVSASVKISSEVFLLEHVFFQKCTLIYISVHVLILKVYCICCILLNCAIQIYS